MWLMGIASGVLLKVGGTNLDNLAFSMRQLLLGEHMGDANGEVIEAPYVTDDPHRVRQRVARSPR